MQGHFYTSAATYDDTRSLRGGAAAWMPTKLTRRQTHPHTAGGAPRAFAGRSRSGASKMQIHPDLEDR